MFTNLSRMICAFEKNIRNTCICFELSAKVRSSKSEGEEKEAKGKCISVKR